MSPWIFVVQLEVDAEVEDEWNAWYDAVHLPEVMAASPAIRRATRFRQTGGSGTKPYCAIYEFDDQHGLEEFMASERLAEMSAQYNEDWGDRSSRFNHSYVAFVERER
jgi:hypothetical protein